MYTHILSFVRRPVAVAARLMESNDVPLAAKDNAPRAFMNMHRHRMCARGSLDDLCHQLSDTHVAPKNYSPNNYIHLGWGPK